MSQRFKDPQAVMAVLREIEALYRRVDEDSRGDTLRDIALKVVSDPDVAIEYLTGVEVWGGSGSMVDLSFDPTPWLLDRSKEGFEQTRAAQHLHAKLLLDLMRELKQSGLLSPWIERRRERLIRDLNW